MMYRALRPLAHSTTDGKSNIVGTTNFTLPASERIYIKFVEVSELAMLGGGGGGGGGGASYYATNGSYWAGCGGGGGGGGAHGNREASSTRQDRILPGNEYTLGIAIGAVGSSGSGGAPYSSSWSTWGGDGGNGTSGGNTYYRQVYPSIFNLVTADGGAHGYGGIGGYNAAPGGLSGSGGSGTYPGTDGGDSYAQSNPPPHPPGGSWGAGNKTVGVIPDTGSPGKTAPTDNPIIIGTGFYSEPSGKGWGGDGASGGDSPYSNGSTPGTSGGGGYAAVKVVYYY